MVLVVVVELVVVVVVAAAVAFCRRHYLPVFCVKILGDVLR